MNVRYMLLLAAAALLLAITPGTLQAQEEEDDGHFFAVSTYHYPFNNLDDIFAGREPKDRVA